MSGVETIGGSSNRSGAAPQEKLWRLDVPLDVTASRGCPGASVNIAESEMDIIRLEKRPQRTLLYLGQRPSDEPVRQKTETRPAKPAGSQVETSDNDTLFRESKMTSFQPALVRCAEKKQRKGFGEQRRHLANGSSIKRVKLQYADYQRHRPAAVVASASQTATSGRGLHCSMLPVLMVIVSQTVTSVFYQNESG